MKATFFYDIRFLVQKGKIYSHYGVSNSIIERYLSIFDEFTYVGRLDVINKKNRHYIQDKYQVTNISLITYKNNYSDVLKVVKKEVERAEFCICRLPSIAGVVAWRECEQQHKPYVVEVVGNAFEALWLHSFKGKILALPIHLVMKHVIKNARFVSYITECYLQSCYPTRGLSYAGIANVSLPKNDEQVLIDRIEHIWKRTENDPINIGMIGSLNVNYKGHDTALKALAHLIKRKQNVKLHFLGQGSSERWVKVATKLGVLDYVQFCGTLPGGKPVLNWLDTMDIYIQPSLTEGHGRATVEAMSRACVTFAAKTGGLVDSVAPNYLFSKRDDKALAKLMERAIKENNYSVEVATNSFYRSKKYEVDLIEEKRRKFYGIAIQYWNDTKP